MRSAPARRCFISSRRASSSSSGSVISFAFTVPRRPSSRSVVTPRPTSARSRRLLEVVPRRVRDAAAAEHAGERTGERRSRPGRAGRGTSVPRRPAPAVRQRPSSPPAGAGRDDVGLVPSEGPVACPARRRFQTSTPMPKTITTAMRTRKIHSISPPTLPTRDRQEGTVARSESTLELPPGCIVTPNRQSAASIVRFW